MGIFHLVAASPNHFVTLGTSSPSRVRYCCTSSATRGVVGGVPKFQRTYSTTSYCFDLRLLIPNYVLRLQSTIQTGNSFMIKLPRRFCISHNTMLARVAQQHYKGAGDDHPTFSCSSRAVSYETPTGQVAGMQRVALVRTTDISTRCGSCCFPAITQVPLERAVSSVSFFGIIR